MFVASIRSGAATAVWRREGRDGPSVACLGAHGCVAGTDDDFAPVDGERDGAFNDVPDLLLRVVVFVQIVSVVCDGPASEGHVCRVKEPPTPAG